MLVAAGDMDAGHILGFVGTIASTTIGLAYFAYTRWRMVKKQSVADGQDARHKRVMDDQEARHSEQNYFDERAKRTIALMEQQIKRVIKEHNEDRTELNNLKVKMLQLETENALLKERNRVLDRMSDKPNNDTRP